MASESAGKEPSASQDDPGVKRRGLLRLGTLIGTLTGASAISVATASSAQAAELYVPMAEKGAPSGVAPLDPNAKLLPAHRGAIAHFPAGVYDVVTTLSLAGYSCQIRGEGAAGTKANPTGTVFYASAQTGPVLDFTGWIIPADVFTGRIRHSDFMVRGSGMADPMKNNAGIRLKTMSSATFADIAIRDTGGPCLEFVSNPGNAVYLCDFERIILNTPVGAKTNDVPYFIADEPNGNRFRSFGLRSMSTAGDCGVSGAIVIRSNTQYPSHGNLLDSCWFENLHVPSGGTLIALQANTTTVSDTQLHDTLKEVGAVNTSVIRLTAPPIANYGGNRITGTIPGSEPATFDTGVDVRQSRNSIIGAKGYKGANVTIAAGVTNTYVALAGAVSGATNPAVVDNSGNLTNTYIDYHLGIETHPNRVVEDTTSTSTRRFYDAKVPNNGGIALGKSGAAICALGGSGDLFYTPGVGRSHIFRDGAGLELFRTTPTGISLAINKSLRLAATPKASRPSAAAAGKGASIYDATLRMPIWSDGSVWRNALGSVV